MLFTTELGHRPAGTGVTTYALHPGVVVTDLWRSVPWPLQGVIKLFMITPEEAPAPRCTARHGARAGQRGPWRPDAAAVKSPSG
ncbi:MAG: hypothetical protein IPJ08_10885 [Burkholderiales bacterium]|nr:hypothetical protein [Burkholderiales bacterium]